MLDTLQNAGQSQIVNVNPMFHMTFKFPTGHSYSIKGKKTNANLNLELNCFTYK